MLSVPTLTRRSFVVRSGTASRCKSTNAQPNSFFESASDYFTKLRWKAAQALTEHLTSEERDKLLRKLNAVDEQQAIQSTQKSIGEAIAEARAAEAQLQTQRWEREKERLMAEAEAAAKARVESDLIIQQRRAGLDRWKRDLQREQDMEKNNKISTVPANTSNAVVVGKIADHPVLGTLVADFGYKRVYVTSSSALASIPVWEKQRIYRHDRAKNMATDKLKTPHLGLPGVITLHEHIDGKLSILDGQHRVGMMTILNEKGNESAGFDLDKILVEVFPQPSGREKSCAEDIFLEVNKAEPVKLVDMPGVASTKDRHMITDCAERLHIKFPEMFSASQNCRPPHLNIDNLRDALFASEAISRHSLKNTKALLDWVMKQNDKLKEHYSNEENSKKVNEKSLAKAKKNDFYLGLESTWLFN